MTRKWCICSAKNGLASKGTLLPRKRLICLQQGMRWRLSKRPTNSSINSRVTSDDLRSYSKAKSNGLWDALPCPKTCHDWQRYTEWAFFTGPTNRRLRRTVVHFFLTISGTDYAFWKKREIPAVSSIEQSADGDQQNDAEWATRSIYRMDADASLQN